MYKILKKRGKRVTLGNFSAPRPTRKLRAEVTSSPRQARLLLEEASSSPGRAVVQPPRLRKRVQHRILRGFP